MRTVFSGILLLVVVSGAALAQETEEPAATEDTAEVTAGETPAASAADERAEEIEWLEPGVPTQVLISDAQSDGQVMDELDLGRTEVTGNQELPTVLYIVPWKQSDPGDLMGRPANTLLDEVLAPVDRGEFTRRVDYYSDLFGETEEQ